jgi:hypothetical protein
MYAWQLGMLILIECFHEFGFVDKQLFAETSCTFCNINYIYIYI